jgi:hypothetical protein
VKVENTIKIRYDKKINQHVDVLVKHFISKNAGISQEDLFEEIDGKLSFTYDDELGGTAELSFGEDERSSFVQVSSDYVIDIKTMLEIIEPLINYEEE